MLNIYFYAKNFRKKLDGSVPLVARLSMNGKRAEVSLKTSIDPEHWSKEHQKAVYTSPVAPHINKIIDLMREKIWTAYYKLNIYDEFDVFDIKNEVQGKRSKINRGLISLFDEHNNRFEERVKIEDAAKGSLTKYKTVRSHLANFIKVSFSFDDLSIKKINPEFIDNFHHYLRVKKTIGHNTTVKYIQALGKILRDAVKYNLIKEDPTQHYSHSVKIKDAVFLNKNELLAIQNLNTENQSLEKVKDCFLFSCFTGLAFCDIKELKSSDIEEGVDGKLWIKKERKKTKNKSYIPLLKIPLKLISKYKVNDKKLESNSDLVFPIPSNQKTNKYLKIIATLAGIDKHLTFHLARHTFATTVALSNGVPLKTVSGILGHSSVKTTEHYAKLVEEKIAKDIDQLRGRLDS